LKSQRKSKFVVRKRITREEKADETRRALFSAAAVIVGKYGYEGASIAKITALAGVANGTFYNYFETRQELFDQLLPAVGERLLDHIRSRVDRRSSGVERERQRMIASFEFFQHNRGFLRVLNEAEVYAPRAFQQHVKKFAADYVLSLKTQLENGELQPLREDELKTIVYILMGARSYLMMLARDVPASSSEVAVESFISTYVKLLERGFFISGKGVTKSVPVEDAMSSAPKRAARANVT
jgi:AcrR family transcriptional regulator